MAYPSNGDPNQLATEMLRGFVGEIEAADDRIANQNRLKSDIFKNAKAKGFNIKALRKVIAARRMDIIDRAKLDNDFDLYMLHVESLAHAHVEIIEEFDHETGEILDHQSTAALKEVQNFQQDVSAHEAAESSQSLQAGTQAPPVDTQSATTAAAIGGEDIAPVLSVDPQSLPVAQLDGAQSSPAGAEGDADRQLNSACLNALKLRPHCVAAQANDLRKCQGYGKVTCHHCRTVHAEEMGEVA